jgi:YD repeat-containing protein
VLGAGWFNSASPFLVRGGPGQGDVYWLVYGPDAFVDFVPDTKTLGKYIGTKITGTEFPIHVGTEAPIDVVTEAPSDQLVFDFAAPASGKYVGTNGAGGVLAVQVANNGPDIVQIHLPDGTLVEFFGFDTDTPSVARGKLWRYGKGPVGSGMKWAYIGSNGLAASAIADGLDASGRVVKAFDSAGRRYDYSYGASGNSTGRLMEVRVSLPYLAAAGAPAPLVARVTYGYQGQSDLPAGYLAETTVQTWPEASTTPGVPSPTSPVLTKRFGYAVAGWGALSRLFDYEGCRRAMLASEIDQTSPAAFWASTALPNYLAANVRYGSSGTGNGRVVSAVFDGLVPAGGGLVPATDNSVWQFAYDMGTAAGISWLRRAVVTTPQTPYGEFIGGAIVEQASGGAAYQSSRWTTQYFDTYYQVGSRVVTTADPRALSGAIPANTGVWATNVARSNPSGRLIRVHSPANAASYIHGTGGSAADGKIGAKPSAGPVTIYDRSTGTPGGDDQNTAKLAGLVYRVQESVGWSGSATGANKLTLQRFELVEAPEITQPASRRPPGRGVRLVSDSVFPTAGSATTNTTQYTETRWQDGTVASLRTKSVKRVPPVVSAANNGSGQEEPWFTMYDPYGRNIGDFSPKKVAALRVYDDRTGLLVESVTDADVRVPAGIASIYSEVPLLNGSSPWTVAGEDAPYQVTKFTRYDHTGRAVMMTDGTGRVSQVVRHVLADRRLVTATVPYLFSSADLRGYP